MAVNHFKTEFLQNFYTLIDFFRLVLLFVYVKLVFNMSFTILVLKSFFPIKNELYLEI